MLRRSCKAKSSRLSLRSLGLEMPEAQGWGDWLLQPEEIELCHRPDGSLWVRLLRAVGLVSSAPACCRETSQGRL